MPIASALRIIPFLILCLRPSALSFLLSTGPAAEALDWAQLDSGTRQQLKKQYNDAGIKVIVSAFGSNEEPTTSGVDPNTTAHTMAQWVIANDLDGIDVDYEDLTAMTLSNGEAEAWLTSFTETLRQTLPKGKYILTHARESLCAWEPPSPF